MRSTRLLTFVTGVALLGLGAALIARSAAPDDDVLGESNPDASVPYGTGHRIDKAFTINRPAGELYRAWRDLERLPEIMSHLRAVEVLDARRSRWHAHGPGKTSASWDAEIIADEPDRRIAWRSLDGGMPNAGSVTFREAPGGRGTELRVEMEWTPPGGALGGTMASIFGAGDPGLMVESDLRRFKARMKAGDIALNGTDVTA